MLVNLYTVFNRVDGTCDSPVISRTDERIASEFANTLYRRNIELTSKKFPPVNPSEYEIRKIGTFEDTTGEVFPCSPVVVPFTLPS